MGGIEHGTPADFARRFLGIEPHAGQIEWLNCRAKTKVACCGRRWGKTYSTSADLLWFAATKPETSQFLIAPTHDQVLVLFNYAERLVRERFPDDAIGKIVRSPFPEITLRNGSLIRARSAGDTGKNLRSHGADRIVFDEAAFIPDVVFETVSPFLATSRYGEQALISTPFGLNRFHDAWQRGQGDDPEIRSFRYPSHTNPHLSRGFLDRQRRDMTGLGYAVEYDAEFHEGQNSVFPWTLVQSCIAGDAEEPEPRHRYVVGWDPAKWRDRSGVVVLDLTAAPWRVVQCLDIAGQDYLQQWPQVHRLADRYHRARVLIDSTHNDPLLELARKDIGQRARGFSFTNPSKQELINGLVIAMEQGRVQFPNLAALVDELTYYRYELTAAGNVKLGADANHHDDLVTALALAVQQAQHGNHAPASPISMTGTSRWRLEGE